MEMSIQKLYERSGVSGLAVFLSICDCLNDTWAVTQTHCVFTTHLVVSCLYVCGWYFLCLL